MRKQGLDNQEGAFGIHVEYSVPLALLLVLPRGGKETASTVDDRIYAASLANRLVRHRQDCPFAAHIGQGDIRVAPRRTYPVGYALQLARLLPDIVQHDVEALCRQTLGDRPADAAAGARDQRARGMGAGCSGAVCATAALS